MTYAHELAAGDVVVLEGGDTRQIVYIHSTGVDSYALVNIDWGGGRHSLLWASKRLCRIWSADPNASLDIEPTDASGPPISTSGDA